LTLASETAFRRSQLGTVMMRCDFLQSSGDIIQVLQNNVIRTRTAAEAGNPQAHSNDYADCFVSLKRVAWDH
jgi:hypothetical protein